MLEESDKCTSLVWRLAKKDLSQHCVESHKESRGELIRARKICFPGTITFELQILVQFFSEANAQCASLVPSLSTLCQGHAANSMAKSTLK